ncbi:MAG: WD40 repeat domain-containing protein [Verrucomicrobiota bacterium]
MKKTGTLLLEDHILDLAWSPDGSRLLATPASGSILVANANGGILETLPGHGMGNGISAWFQKHPATCGFDGRVRWNGSEWKPGHGVIEVLKASPDDTLLAVGQGKNLHIRDAAGDESLSLRDLDAVVSDFAWNPANPRQIALAGAGGAVLRKLGGKHPFARFDWGGASLKVRWSLDGRWLATGDQTPSVHVYDIPRDHPLHMQGFEGKVHALDFSSDSRQLATAGSPVITVWPMTGKKGPENVTPIQIEGSETPVQALAFSPATGQLASGDTTGILLIITFEKGQLRRKRAPLESGIASLAWHPSMPLLAIGHDDGHVTILETS